MGEGVRGLITMTENLTFVKCTISKIYFSIIRNFAVKLMLFFKKLLLF